MAILGGFFEHIGLAMAGKRNPWGKPPGGGDGDGSGNSGGGSGDGEEPTGERDAGDTPPRGPRNPWLPGGGTGEGPRRSASIDDIFRNRGPEGPRRRGGPGGPGGKSWFPVAVGAIALLWLGITSTHQVDAREQGIVTWLGGKYSRTLDPGLNFTMPWPIQAVDIENVSEIRLETVGGGEENLILTGDQNLVDLSYLVRWNIADLTQYRFQLLDPIDTVREVAESAMRESVAETDLDRLLSGAGRAQVELRVRTRMQSVLDAYGAGITVQGVEIARTEAPEQVIEAFNDVLAARQDAERNLNDARRYEQQLLAQAQGDAAAFNNIYEEYRLAPEVTRRRLYYETMESVLRGTDMTIVEAEGVTPFLPLPEVQRRSQAQQPPSLTVTPQGGQ